MTESRIKMALSKFEPYIFNTVKVIAMLVVIVVMVYPFWNTVAVSLNNSQDTLHGGITFFPRQFSLYNYKTVFENDLLVIATVNSVLRSLLSAILGVFISALIAFVLSRPEFLWRKFVTIYFGVTMFVSAGLLPNYFLIKDLHLLNNFLVYIIPGLINVFNVIVIKTYMQSIPAEITEAAIIDGAGYFRCFIEIIIPCCKPVLATVALWCAVGAWNSWFDTFIYCSSKESLTTLQYEMMKMISASMNAGTNRSAADIYGSGVSINTVTPVSIQAAVTVVASVPILFIYPFLQKYFVQGVTVGSVKG